MSVPSLLAVSRGDIPAELVLKGALVANVLSMELEEADVAIHEGRIAGVGKGYEGKQNLDLSGMTLAPGFFDAHCHIESTMLVPSSFAGLVAARGTSAVAADPHEIANTCGMAGIEYMFLDAMNCPVDFFYTAPSCVPASSFETPLEPLGAEMVSEMFSRGWCHSLGEVMNFPAVIAGGEDIWRKITAASGRVKNGHAPGLTGRNLCAYLVSGCDSDHECTLASEALEKLRRGMWLMIREGATEKNLEELAPLIREDERRASRCMLVSDDLTASYIRDRGHMDEKVRLAVACGISPLSALRMVTLSPATYFGLRDRGAIAPGYLADIVAVDDIESCRVRRVWKNGRSVATYGNLERPCGGTEITDAIRVSGADLTSPKPEDLGIPVKSGNRIRVIGVLPGQVITEHRVMEPRIISGKATADPSRDVALMAVMEKNRGTGRLSQGFVQGLGLKEGAIGSSVAHDAHNFVVAGMDELSISTAFRKLVSSGGGLVAARGTEVTAFLSLPAGGLMNPGRPDEVIESLKNLEMAASELGTTIENPFMTMSFLCLSVIPELKLTDSGYVDFSRGGAQEILA
ncbi:MAG TPA: adenine deaminase [Synergistales bacterium]|nr:adenine deaminase [Synergistales bacterium]